MIVADGATVVTRKLIDDFSTDTLTRLWHGVVAEGAEVQHMFLAPSDFTSYGNQLTGLRRYQRKGDELDHQPGRTWNYLGLMGRKVYEVPLWPRGTMGFVVMMKEGA